MTSIATAPIFQRDGSTRPLHHCSYRRDRICARNWRLGLVAATGASVPRTVSAFWVGAFGSNYAIGASLNRAVPFALVELGFILAARGNLTNVGGEGQIAVGGILATATALHGAGDLPPFLAVAAPLLAGGLAGALWGGIAGWLKVRRGTNEVISTLLLSFIAVNLVYWSVSWVEPFAQAADLGLHAAEVAEIPDVTKLPPLTSDPSSPLHIGLVLALVAGSRWRSCSRSQPLAFACARSVSIRLRRAAPG